MKFKPGDFVVVDKHEGWNVPDRISSGTWLVVRSFMIESPLDSEPRTEPRTVEQVTILTYRFETWPTKYFKIAGDR